jgi:hypothetical protein
MAIQTLFDGETIMQASNHHTLARSAGQYPGTGGGNCGGNYNSSYRELRVINPRDAGEITFWAGQFDVPPSKLVAVVREVGRTVAEIRRCLST